MIWITTRIAALAAAIFLVRGAAGANPMGQSENGADRPGSDVRPGFDVNLPSA